MSVFRYAMPAAVMTAWLATSGYGETQAAAPMDGPADLPTMTSQTGPQQVACDFIAALERFLRDEHSRPKDAQRELAFAGSLIADEPIEGPLTELGYKIKKIQPEKILALKETIASTWAAVINYYVGHITYPKAASAPTTQPRLPRAVTVRLPAHVPGPTRPVEIIVTCVREGTWKVKFVGLAATGVK